MLGLPIQIFFSYDRSLWAGRISVGIAGADTEHLGNKLVGLVVGNAGSLLSHCAICCEFVVSSVDHIYGEEKDS